MFALSRIWRGGTAAAVLAYGLLASWGAVVSAQDAPQIDGRELFMREWIPGDARSHGGDGLGPVFNDTSCVACHNQGGVGGAGPAAKNAQLVTVFSNGRPDRRFEASSKSLVGALLTIIPYAARSETSENC